MTYCGGTQASNEVCDTQGAGVTIIRICHDQLAIILT